MNVYTDIFGFNCEYCDIFKVMTASVKSVYPSVK